MTQTVVPDLHGTDAERAAYWEHAYVEVCADFNKMFDMLARHTAEQVNSESNTARYKVAYVVYQGNNINFRHMILSSAALPQAIIDEFKRIGFNIEEAAKEKK